MNTTRSLMSRPLKVVEDYYRHMLLGEFDAMAACLHPEVVFASPLARMSGRIAVAEAARSLRESLVGIDFRAKFESEDGVMLAYDFEFKAPRGRLPSAGWMTVKDGCIASIELYFDASGF